MIVRTKISGKFDPDYHLVRAGVNIGGAPRFILSASRLACIVPGGVYNFVREAYRKVKYDWLGKPRPDTFYARVEHDELRR
jgi:hypothetical protein